LEFEIEREEGLDEHFAIWGVKGLSVKVGGKK